MLDCLKFQLNGCPSVSQTCKQQIPKITPVKFQEKVSENLKIPEATLVKFQEKVSENPEDCKPGSDDCRVSVVLYKQFFSGKEAGANQTLAIERNELMKEIREKARSMLALDLLSVSLSVSH